MLKEGWPVLLTQQNSDSKSHIATINTKSIDVDES